MVVGSNPTQKQSFVGFLTRTKRRICGVVSVLKCDFNSVLKSHYAVLLGSYFGVGVL